MAWCRSQPEESTRTPHQSTETESGICYREQQAGSSVDKMSKLRFKSEQFKQPNQEQQKKQDKEPPPPTKKKSKKFLRTALLHAANDGGSETKRHQRTTTTKTCWLNPRQQCREKGKVVHLGFTWQTNRDTQMEDLWKFGNSVKETPSGPVMEEKQESSAHTSALLALSSTIHSVQVTTNMEKEGTPGMQIYINILFFGWWH